MNYPGRGDGRDGDLILSANTNDASPVSTLNITAGSQSGTLDTGLSINAGDCLFLHQSQGSGPGHKEFAFVQSYVSGTGAVTFVSAVTNAYTTAGNDKAEATLLRQYRSVDLGGFILTGQSWDGSKKGIVGFLCSGEVKNGTVAINGVAGNTGTDTPAGGVGGGFRGGAGKNETSNVYAQYGEGTPGPAATPGSPSVVNGNGGGGAFRNLGDRWGGGGGGNAAAGGNGSGSGSGNVGVGGEEKGNATLTSIVFGGGGGGGTNDLSVTTTGGGGSGGGIIVIVANSIASTVTLQANGGNGGGGVNGAGGGGGAGGSILIMANSASIGSVSATGGTTNGGGSSGGNGAVGRIRVEACSITGESSPAASKSEGGHQWCSSGGFIY